MNLLTPIDVVIVCALHRPELEKLLETNEKSWTSVPSSSDDPTSYYTTDFATLMGGHLRVVAAAANQMGPTATAVLTAKMILRFRPRLVAMVGIAAGAKSESQNYGDILAAERTFAYDSGKSVDSHGAIKFLPDPQPLEVSPRILARLKDWTTKKYSAALDSIRNDFYAPPNFPLRLHVGPIGSGTSVVDEKKTIKEITSHWRKLIGVEMEAYSAHRACQEAIEPSVPYLCIKAICDFAQNKTDTWQSYAAYTAAQFFFRFLVSEWETLKLAPLTTALPAGSETEESAVVLPASRHLQGKQIEAHLAAAREEVVACGIHFQWSLSDHEALLLKSMSKGIQYLWVIPDPRKTGLVSRIARTIGVPQEELQRECDDGFLKLQRLYRQANDGGIAHRMRVLLSSVEPSGRYYLFDHRKAEGTVIYTPYIFGVRSSHSPALVLPANSHAARQYIDSCVAYAEVSSECSLVPRRETASRSRRLRG